MSYQLSKHFSLDELTLSQTAARLSIDNTPSPKIIENLKRLSTDLLEPIRDLLGCPIHVSSGYRSPALNHKIGGAQDSHGNQTSAHCYGFAADITAPAFGTPREIAHYLSESLHQKEIGFDQIIFEFGSWVHVAIFNRFLEQRGQVLTAQMIGGHAHYVPGVL